MIGLYGLHQSLSAAARQRSAFRSRARHALTQFGRVRGRRNLAAWTLPTDGEPLSAADLVSDYRLLRAMLCAAHLEQPGSTGGVVQDADVRQVQRMLRSRTLPMQALSADIPKFTAPGTITPVIAEDAFTSDSRCHDGSRRTLHFSDLSTRAAQKALAWVISAFYADRLGSHVVGFQPGVGGPEILATLERTLAATGCRVLLQADISACFPSIPLRGALDLLDRDTSYRSDPDLRSLIEYLVTPDQQGGLAQGHPLSPLLANIYLAHHLDPLILRRAFMVRYVDDVLVICRTHEEAAAIYTDVQQRLATARGHGTHAIALHPTKTVITDLCTGSVTLADITATVASDDLGRHAAYLGYRLRWVDDRLDLDIADKGLWSLHESLREVVYAPRNAAGMKAWCERFMHLLPRLIGWLEWYGVAIHAGRPSAAVVQRICTLAIGTTEDLVALEERWDPDRTVLATTIAALQMNGYLQDAGDQVTAADIPGIVGGIVRAAIDRSTRRHADAEPITLVHHQQSWPTPALRGNAATWRPVGDLLCTDPACVLPQADLDPVASPLLPARLPLPPIRLVSRGAVMRPVRLPSTSVERMAAGEQARVTA